MNHSHLSYWSVRSLANDPYRRRFGDSAESEPRERSNEYRRDAAEFRGKKRFIPARLQIRIFSAKLITRRRSSAAAAGSR